MHGLRFAISMLVLGPAIIPQATGQDNFFDTWQVKDGLPQNSVNEIAQTPDGYLWLGTEGGLSRFDGREFTTFDVENTPELGSNRITCLHVTRSGDLLIGTYNGGLTVLKNKVFYDHKDAFGAKRYTIREIIEDPSGRIWFSNTANNTLNALDARNYALLEVSAEIIKDVAVTLFVQNGIYYFPSYEGIKLRDSALQPISGMEDFILPQHLEAVVKDNGTNHYWIITNDSLLRMKENRAVEGFKIPQRQQFSQYIIKFIQVADKLYMSFYGDHKMLIFDIPSSRFTILDFDKICEKGSVNDIFEDNEENLWIATDICGLVKLKPERFSYLGSGHTQIDHNIYPINRDSLGRMLIGTRQSDMLILDEKQGKLSNPDYLLIEGSFVTSIEPYKGAIYYAAVSRNYILKWQGENVEKIYFPNGRRQQTNAIYAARNGELLVGTEEGIYTLDGNKLITHPISKRVDVRYVHNFYEDRQGLLWIVSDHNVVCYDSAADSIHFKISPSAASKVFYRGISGDRDGNIYVGSYGFGLHIVRNGKMHTVTKNHGLAENVVSTITEDKSGNLWLTGNTGLSRISKAELFAVIDHRSDKLNTVLYNEQTDGLRTGEFNGGMQQDKYWLGGERYAFPSLKGAVVVDFADMRFNTLPPPVHIQKLSLADTLYEVDHALSLPYTEGRMEIFFTALSFVSPQNVRFRYKMEGYEKEWIDAGTERKTSYSKLPPGKYTFRVIACNNEGVWNEEGASLPITVVPPYYLTWWFRVGAILLLIALTALIVWQAVSRYRKRERQKSALMDLLPDLVFKIDQDGNYLDIYGKPTNFPEPLESFDKKKISDFLPESISDDARKKIALAIESGEMQEYPYKIVQANGATNYFDSRFIAIDRKEVLCIIRDITRSKLAEKQIRDGERKLLDALEIEKKLLKKLTAQQKLQLEAIVRTEESERKRIATDLHDGIGQLLSSVKINLGIAMEKAERSDYNTTTLLLNKSTDSINQITKELRNISYNLLPPSLEQFGLASAIEEEVNKLKSKPDLFIHFDNSTTGARFEQKIELILFRVFQEMLNNALKHAEAREITIQLIEHGNTLVLMFEDNGRGFNKDVGLLKKNSSGLKNLYSRINLIQGTINIDSTPASGTTITIEIPITP